MGKWLLGFFALLLGAALVAADAEARRLGGARSLGAQRNVTAPPAKAAPQAAPSKQAQQQGQAAPAASRWAPILGGLALGGFLGYLFAGNGLGGVLLLALLAMGAVLLFRALAARRGEAPVQFAAMRAGMRAQAEVPRPTAPSGGQVTRFALPAAFDTAAFLRGAKLNFVKLQLANDAGALEEIREFTTDEMFEALKSDIAARAVGAQQTEVAGLDAELLELATEGGKHWASVRFSGMVRETADAAAGFEEVWNLVKPADGSSGWLLAGIQQMH